MSVSSGSARVRTLQCHSQAIPQHLGAPLLEPVRLSGHEALNELFAYELFLRTPDGLNPGAALDAATNLDLDAFIGQEITCSIELDGAGEFLPGVVGASVDRIGAGVREISGLITEARLWGEEGRRVQYRLTIRPWLHLATLSTDCKIFQNQSVVQTLDELLADYPFPVDKRLIETYPLRDYGTQYNETDFQFFERLCQEWGINYFFEHSGGKHRLVLIDNMGAYQGMPSQAYRRVEYHPPNWKLDAEYIHAFAPHHQLTSGRYATRDYDYRRPRADLTSARKDPRPTAHADGEVYQWHADAAGSHYAQPLAGVAGPNDPLAEGDLFARLRMQQLRTHGARATASGNLRGMVPGCTFKLTRHPRDDANAEYLVLGTRFLIEDIGQESQPIDAGPGRGQHWRVQVDITAHPSTEALRPDPTRRKPHTHGPQVAVVVGPDGQNLWTDDLGRIKVQFPWDRIAHRNEHSTCWVRVSSPWAGNQLGGIHIPRIGQEVVVDFIGGDPDLPICTGRVHNQFNQPPWHLPDQSALSGFRSRELTGGGGNSAAGRSNHLLMDDTPGKIQTQLKSDHQSSSLSLGAITRVEDNAGRKDARGEGYELRTDGHGVMRAMAGMLISTEARVDAARHAKDLDETVARLGKARSLHENLSSAAHEAQAQERGDQDQVVKAIQGQNDAIRGEGSADAGAGRFPEIDEPHLVLASAAGIEATSTHSMHLHAGEHVAITSGEHTSIASDKSLLASAREAIRFFAYASGMRWVAYQGDIVLKAIKNSIKILANIDVTVTADVINIAARKKLSLSADGSYLHLDAQGIVGGTQGIHRIFAKVHSLAPPKNVPTDAFGGRSSLKDDPLVPSNALTFVLRSHPEDGRPIALEPYTLYKDGTEIEKGATDAKGRIIIKDHKPGTQAYKVRLSNGNVFDLPVHQKLGNADAKLAAKGYRAAQDDPQDRYEHFRQRQGGEE